MVNVDKRKFFLWGGGKWMFYLIMTSDITIGIIGNLNSFISLVELYLVAKDDFCKPQAQWV